jgi:accessory gene regulator protein AgrB
MSRYVSSPVFALKFIFGLMLFVVAGCVAFFFLRDNSTAMAAFTSITAGICAGAAMICKDEIRKSGE